MQPSIDQLTEELVPYERPNITVPTQEEMQPSIDQLTEELATDEEVPEVIVTASKEQTVLTQEEMQPSIDQLTEELAPYERPSINIPTIDEETAQEDFVNEDEKLQQLSGPTDEEPIDATEKEGSLAKETESAQTPVDYNKLLTLAGTLISGSLATRPSTTRPSTTTPSTSITQPSVSTSTTPSSLTDEDIYKDAPIKGFSMRPTASGRYVPYIGEKAQLAKGGLVSKPKKSNSKGLAGRRK